MRRPARAPLLLLVAGALLAAAAIVWQRVDGSDGIVLDAGSEEGLTVMWTGDTMLGDAASDVIAQRGIRWPLDGVSHVLDADVVIVNAEAPITTRNEPFLPNKAYSYASDPTAAGALADAGVDVLGLANNHAMDQGPVGLADTMRWAEEAGLVTVGAGMDMREAERPLLIRSPIGTVGIVAMAKGYGSRVTAGRERAGTIPLSTAAIRRGHRLAVAAGADWVVGYVHWGENYERTLPEQRRQAARFAAAGYDLVVGHGPHVSHGAEVIDGMPVLHSIGNFVFGSPGRFDEERPGYGFILETTFTPQGLGQVELTCIVVDNRIIHYQPRPCEVDEAAEAFENLGVPVDQQGPTALLRLPAA